MITSLGAQLYTIRSVMTDETGILESFRHLKAIGYDEVQTAGWCGISARRFSELAAEAGIKICGTLCDFNALISDPDRAMEEHDLCGTKFIGVSIMPNEYREDLSRIGEFIEKANKFADYIGKYGFKFTYHNHSFEFRKVNGKRIMDMFAEDLHPTAASFVLDTYWVQHGGGDVIAWMKKLAGRIDILHLKDMGMEQTQFFTEIGNGNINFNGIIKTAEEIGVKHYVVEQDICPGDPFDSLAQSHAYIKSNYMN